MLAHTVAIAVILESFLLYMAAFVFPEVRRPSDWGWSLAAFVSGLILWNSDPTEAQVVAEGTLVAAIAWFGWQTLVLRRAVAGPLRTTVAPSVADKLRNAQIPALWQQLTQVSGGEIGCAPNADAEKSDG